MLFVVNGKKTKDDMHTGNHEKCRRNTMKTTGYAKEEQLIT